MLTIRLQRRGRKNDPSFRVLVLESQRGPKSGSYLDLVGSYDARTDRVELNAERIKHWISKGATVSDTVHNLLVTKGIVEGKKRNVLPKKTVAKVDLPAGEAGAPAVAAAAEVAPEAASVEESSGDLPVGETGAAEEVAAEEVAAEAAPEEVPAEEPAA